MHTCAFPVKIEHIPNIIGRLMAIPFFVDELTRVRWAGGPSASSEPEFPGRGSSSSIFNRLSSDEDDGWTPGPPWDRWEFPGVRNAVFLRDEPMESEEEEPANPGPAWERDPFPGSTDANPVFGREESDEAEEVDSASEGVDAPCGKGPAWLCDVLDGAFEFPPPPFMEEFGDSSFNPRAFLANLFDWEVPAPGGLGGPNGLPFRDDSWRPSPFGFEASGFSGRGIPALPWADPSAWL